MSPAPPTRAAPDFQSLPKETHANIATCLCVADVGRLQASSKLLQGLYRVPYLEKCLSIEEEARRAVELCDEWDSLRALRNVTSEEIQYPYYLAAWMRYSEDKGITGIPAMWASQRTKLRLLCWSCGKMKLVEDMPTPGVRSKRVVNQRLCGEDIRRWQTFLTDEAFWREKKEEFWNNIEVPVRYQCGQCSVGMGEWIPLGPFGQKYMVRCQTCGKEDHILSKDQRCCRWLLEGGECVECHRQNPAYRSFYKLEASLEMKSRQLMKELGQLSKVKGWRRPPSMTVLQRHLRRARK